MASSAQVYHREGQVLINAETGEVESTENRCPTYRELRTHGQFVVSMAGAAYDAQVERLTRNSPSGGVH